MARRGRSGDLIGAFAVAVVVYFWASGKLTGLTVGGSTPSGIAIPPDAQQAVNAARNDLRTFVGNVPITVTLVQAVNWADTSLACPLPNTVYAPTVVPGWRIGLLANGQYFEYHTDQIGARVCRVG